MIKELIDLKKYKEFVDRVMDNEKYADPLLVDEKGKQYFYHPKNTEDKRFIGVFDKEQIVGIFVLYVIKDERYIEVTHIIADTELAYTQFFELLEKEYEGYLIDFVFNARNDLLMDCLQKNHASFDEEQQKMILETPQLYKGKHNIVLYEDKYKEGYQLIHNDEGIYWTADKVLEALDEFRVILCVKDEKVVGYVDITYKDEENEPFDVFVKEEYRSQGICKEMLSLAIELNGDKRMRLNVDVNNPSAIKAYASLGFRVTGINTITAHISI